MTRHVLLENSIKLRRNHTIFKTAKQLPRNGKYNRLAFFWMKQQVDKLNDQFSQREIYF